MYSGDIPKNHKNRLIQDLHLVKDHSTVGVGYPPTWQFNTTLVSSTEAVTFTAGEIQYGGTEKNNQILLTIIFITIMI